MRPGTSVLALFSTTLFLSATLLFTVQPMFAKMVLPLLGGAPAVWNTCMVFFQATLLTGYAYAHATTVALGRRRQAALHAGLLLAPLLVLPITVPSAWTSPEAQSPLAWLLGLLLVALGLPFFVVSTTAPLVQTWFGRARHARADDPYFLYAASNAGSLAALVAYPTLIEPHLRLADQSRLWTAGYLALAALLIGCAVVVWRFHLASSLDAPPGPVRPGGEMVGAANTSALAVRERARWLVLSCIPSSLLLGVTTYLTTDVAPMPLFWVLPFALYLLSFVLVFSRAARVPSRLMNRLVPFLVLPLIMSMAWGALGPLWALLPLHLLTFFVLAMVCHGELARSRPAPERLTEFFLWMAGGGVLGGILNALVAPSLFSGVIEYPLALIAACLLRPAGAPRVATRAGAWLVLAAPAVVAAFVAVLVWLARMLPIPSLLVTCAPALLCFAVRRRPVAFGLSLGAMIVTTVLLVGDEARRTLHRERSFFGVWKVQVHESGKFHVLTSGTTVHGWQSRDPAHEREPLSYFHRSGPIGQVFAALSERAQPVAVIGLGTGSLACHGARGQHFTFYEIDPAVLRIASDRHYFTYLAVCPPQTRVVLGDARRSLATAPDRHYGLIVLDAFSSDAIPTHLLTREALGLYLRKLAEGGLLAFHISNRHLDLAPTVGNLAHDASLVAVVQLDSNVSATEQDGGKTSSHWVVLARRREDLGGLAFDARWSPLPPRPDKTLWTDDFSNMFEIIKWR